VPEKTFDFHTARLAIRQCEPNEPLVVLREVQLPSKRVMFPVMKLRNDVGAKLQQERSAFFPDY